MAELNLGHVVGPGVPTGGTSGQVLKKNSATNFDTSWSANDATTIPMSSSDSTSINEAIATLNNKIGALPSDTTVTSLDEIKTVLKNTFDGMASGARKTVAFVTNSYSGDYFEIAKRYAGVLEKTSNTSATCRLSNNNSHFVTVGLVVSSGTYTWTFTSLSDQIKKQSVTVTPTSALKSNAGRLFGYKTGNIAVITCLNIVLDSAISSDTEIASLSVTPNEQYFANCMTIDGTPLLAFVKTDGKLYLSGINTPPANKQIYLSLSFVTA